MSVDAQTVCLAEERLLLEPVEPAGVVAALDDHVGSLGREHRTELSGREHGLVGGDLRTDLPPHPGEARHVLRRRGLLDPVEVVPFEPADAVDRGREVPRLVRVDPQERLRPDRLTHRRDARLVALRAPADLEVDDAVALARELASVCREAVGVVALQEAEVVELVVDGAPEERPCRHAARAAECVPAGDLDPREDDLGELWPHSPAALTPDRAQDRLHVARRVTDDLPRHELAVRGDRARVLADRLAEADHAVVGVDGEEHDVRTDLRAPGPVEHLRERDRERRRLDAGDPHGKSFRPKTAAVVSPRSSAATISSSRSSSVREAASTSSAAPAATIATPSASAQTRSPGWTVTPPS